MALLLMDGLDNADGTDQSLIDYGWSINTSYISASSTGGRWGGGAIYASSTSSAYARKAFSQTSNGTVRMSVSVNTIATEAMGFIGIDNNAETNQCYEFVIGVNNSGQLEARRATSTTASFRKWGDATAIATDPRPRTWEGIWHHIEAEVVLSTTATGSVKVYLDGNLVINETSVQTSYTQTTANWVAVGGRAYYDDVVAWDSSGSSFTTFPLGDMRITSLRPTSNSTPLNWTPLSGTNYAAVDEARHDGDTSYVYATATALADLYASTDTVDSGYTIHAINNVIVAGKGDAGDSTTYSLVKTGTTTATSAGEATPATYGPLYHFLATNPETSSAWTASEVNSINFGIESG